MITCGTASETSGVLGTCGLTSGLAMLGIVKCPPGDCSLICSPLGIVADGGGGVNLAPVIVIRTVGRRE